MIGLSELLALMPVTVNIWYTCLLNS